MVNERDSNSILVPAPTAWPFMAALGITLMFTGLVTHPVVSLVGAAVFLRAAPGWWFDGLPQQKEEAVLVSLADRTRAQVPRSSAAVDRLTTGIGGHRARIPVEVHPYWTGLYGGAGRAVQEV